MSTYLLAFSVADYRNLTEKTSDGKLDFSVYASRDAIKGMQFALDVGQKALKALEEYIELDYTLGKIDFIAIDDFLMGAMENWVRNDFSFNS